MRPNKEAQVGCYLPEKPFTESGISALFGSVRSPLGALFLTKHSPFVRRPWRRNTACGLCARNKRFEGARFRLQYGRSLFRLDIIDGIARFSVREPQISYCPPSSIFPSPRIIPRVDQNHRTGTENIVEDRRENNNLLQSILDQILVSGKIPLGSRFASQLRKQRARNSANRRGWIW